jgi:hypothetical protein
LVEVARSGDGFEALAVLNVPADTPANDLASAAESAPSGAVPATQLPLPYAL